MDRPASAGVALRGLSLLLPSLFLVAALSPSAMGQGGPGVEPGLELIAGSDRIVYEREKGSAIWLDLGLLVAAPDAPFEVRLRRDNYTSDIEVWQVLRGAGNSTEDRPLPLDVAAGWHGLDDFFVTTIRNADGEVSAEITADFCPNAYEAERVNDAGPQTPTYPYSCGWSPFTKGMVWGIDEGWAARVIDIGNHPIRLRAGRYDVTVAIAPRYVDLFALDPATTTAEIELKVKTVVYDDGYPFHSDAPRVEQKARATGVPTITPDPATLPDLYALPAWGMGVQIGKTRTRLSFSATVGVGGASSLVVEGFRRADGVMDAYQYFYSGGEVVGRAPVGTMEFDDRDGHFHWHFQQFARYSLLDGDQNEILLSKKESFCLAATDAIDLLLPGVQWRVGNSDLSTACGQKSSLWVREILPLGWADTYTQTLRGQSFNITDLPNGRYFVAVEANPGGSLYEQSTDDNIELREIFLKGRGLNRRVEVPPWNGIDTENIPDPKMGHPHDGD